MAANITDLVTSAQVDTDLGVYLPSLGIQACAPMDVKQIRKKNLKRLVDEAHGPTHFSRLVDRSPNLVTQWLSSKKIGDSIARHIEQSTGKPHGWMDAPNWHAGVAEEATPYGISPDRETLRDALLIVERAVAQPGVRISAEGRTEITLEVYELLQQGQSAQVAERILGGMLRALTDQHKVGTR